MTLPQIGKWLRYQDGAGEGIIENKWSDNFCDFLIDTGPLGVFNSLF